MGARSSFMVKKINYLKKILGKRMVVIKDHTKNIYFYATISNVIDESNVEIINSNGDKETVSIFDLRSPSQDY